MSNKILIICPTRENGDSIEKFYTAFKNNSSICDLVFSLDYDDQFNYPRFNEDNVFYEVGYRNNIVSAINTVAYKYSQNKEYEFIGMLNDDHIIKTKDWDKTIYEKIKGIDFAIAYPNDLDESIYKDEHTNIAGARNLFASSVIMDSSIVRILGYFANPVFEHAYVDRIWIDMGRKMNTLYYFDDVIVAHERHFKKHAINYINGNKDGQLYYSYIKNYLDNDILKLKEYKKIYG